MKKGRLIIIAGNKRAGKTTLCNRLADKGFIYLKFDYLLDVLDEVMEKPSIEKDFEFFNKLVNRYHSDTINYNQNIVIDVFDFNPSMLGKLDLFKEVEIYVLAYPNCNKDEIEYCLRNYGEKFEWNINTDSENIKRNIEIIYEKNKILEKECEKYNVRLFDVGIKEIREQRIEEIELFILN